MAELTIDYRLPVTVVRFNGVRTTTEVAYRPPSRRTTTTTTAGASVEVRADPRTLRSVTIPSVDMEKLDLTVKLLDDGRLASADTTIDPRSEVAWRAALANGVALGAAGGVVAGPIGAAAGVLLGSLGTLAAGATPFKSLAPSTLGLPTAEEAHVEDAYVREHPSEADALIAFRTAIGRLVQAHATTALTSAGDPDVAERLVGLERALLSTQRVARRSEDLYTAWLVGQVTERREVVALQLHIDELPTAGDLASEAQQGAAQHRDRGWWEVVEQLGLMVSCDLLPEGQDRPTPAEVVPRTQRTIGFRPPCPAVLRTWRLTRDPDRAGHWLAPILVDATWALVSHPASEREITAPFTSAADATLNLGFSPAGALSQVTSKTSGAAGDRAEVLAALPAALSGATDQGIKLGAAFSPTALELAQRKQEGELRQALAKLRPTSDPLASQRRALEEAELAARLAVANELRADPSRVLVTLPAVTITT